MAKILKEAGLTELIALIKAQLALKADQADFLLLEQQVNQIIEDLENYYTKDETYSKEEVDHLIDLIPKFHIEIVDELPSGDSDEPISETTVYLLPKADSDEVANVYEEWIYTNFHWEKIGDTAIDLSNYYTKDEVDEMLLEITPKDVKDIWDSVIIDSDESI